MNFTTSIVALSTLVILNGCIVIASPSHHSFNLTKELKLDAESLNELAVEAGAGSLSIKGQEGLTDIRVKAEISTSSEDNDHYQLTLTNSGSTAYLVAKYKGDSSHWSANTDSPQIDLTVLVPPRMLLDINDGSGDLLVKDMTNMVKIKDSSGDLIVDNVNGDLAIDDGSGRIEVSEVMGRVKIVDGSGEMKLSDIKGSIDIEDGSGEMRLSDIEGHIEIEDSSGSIHVMNVNGNISLDDGSGDLTVSHVSGMVTVVDGSGDIDVQDTGGLNILETGSGDLRINNINGELAIDN
jgi:hypothetical protein